MAKAPFFYNCILIDGYRYKTVAKQWKPQTSRPSTARVNLLGNLEATYGGFTILRWEGMVIAPVVAPAKGASEVYPWGDIENLRASVQKAANIVFIDHYGKKYDPTTILADAREDSLQNVWNGDANKVYLTLSLMSTAAAAVQLTNTQYP